MVFNAFFQYPAGHGSGNEMDTIENYNLYQDLLESGNLPEALPRDINEVKGVHYMDLYYFYLRIWYESKLLKSNGQGIDLFTKPSLDEYESRRFWFDYLSGREAPTLAMLCFFVNGHPSGRSECLARLDTYINDNRRFEQCVLCVEWRPIARMRAFVACGHRCCEECVENMPRHPNQERYNLRLQLRQAHPERLYSGELVPQFNCHICRYKVNRVSRVFE